MSGDINFNNYSEIKEYLLSIQEKEYKKFNKKIVASNDKFMGVRTPFLKELAKKIAINNWRDIYAIKNIEYHEEKLLKGLILGYVKEDFKILMEYIDDFVVNYIDNWAICDSFITNLKIIKKNKENKEEFYEYILTKEDSNNFWEHRFLLVSLWGYYIEDAYLDSIFGICDRIESHEYYVKMGKAWLISTCFVKFPTETKHYLKNNKLDNWTHNKSIQKIRESLRVQKEEKEELLKYKRS